MDISKVYWLKNEGKEPYVPPGFTLWAMRTEGAYRVKYPQNWAITGDSSDITHYALVHEVKTG